ncbi:wsc domain-containing protein [Fusarium denticulatum]|uniref:Wsc domain-containing protein n=1 Tax=Fusarium denticulatum TaxID=48507 RepID=A0A8H5UCG8_9HYPO|nr:wsc domain-containing protein [Fusarium denticulatum]
MCLLHSSLQLEPIVQRSRCVTITNLFAETSELLRNLHASQRLQIDLLCDASNFQDRWHGDSHPFVFSNSDPTGYGLHGDFLNGWDVKILQKAVKECTDASGVIEKCRVLTFFDDDAMNGCRVPVQIDEKTNGVLKTLPGCNPVTFGPELATPVVGEACNATKEISPPKWPFTDVTGTKKFRYLGCARDSYGSRSLDMTQSSADNMTIELCLDYCERRGYLLAGLEYGRVLLREFG